MSAVTTVYTDADRAADKFIVWTKKSFGDEERYDVDTCDKLNRGWKKFTKGLNSKMDFTVSQDGDAEYTIDFEKMEQVTKDDLDTDHRWRWPRRVLRKVPAPVKKKKRRLPKRQPTISPESRGISCLPEHLISRILLTATTHTDLLRHVSVCARVCPEWWKLVMGSMGYGGRLRNDPLKQYPDLYEDYAGQMDHLRRHKVLKEIAEGLRNMRGEGLDHVEDFAEYEHEGVIDVCTSRLGDEGCRILGAALQAMPTPLSTIDMRLCGFKDLLYMQSKGMPPDAVPATAAVLRDSFPSGIEELVLDYNSDLGDAGWVLLAPALPSTIEKLSFNRTGCGNAGMIAIAKRLPALKQLKHLEFTENHGVGDEGWAALACALPQLPVLRCFNANQCHGLHAAGALSLAAALPRCSSALLEFVIWDSIGDWSLVLPRAGSIIPLVCARESEFFKRTQEEAKTAMRAGWVRLQEQLPFWTQHMGETDSRSDRK